MLMPVHLAYAEPTDFSGGQWSTILGGLAVIGAIGVMAIVIIALARHHRHPRQDAITVLALLWGLATAGSAIHFLLAWTKWKKNYLILIKTGYYDPRNLSGAPAWPWYLWGALAVGFAVLVLYSLWRKKTAPPPPQAP